MPDKQNTLYPILPEEALLSKIYFMRGKKIMLDYDLALLYEVPTKRLNEQVKRNINRFPQPLFMFQLSQEEWNALRSQTATLKGKGKYTKYLPYAFTEQGVAMLSSILNSEKAIQVNIQIIIIFTKMREMLAQNVGLKRQIEALEHKYQDHDERIREIFFTLKKLMDPPQKRQRKEIGFHTAMKT